MKITSIFLTICIMILSGCDSSTVTDQFMNVDEHGWVYDSPVETCFEITDTNHYYQWLANLRVTSDYEYMNMQLKITTLYPDSSEIVEYANIQLAEKSGKWLGSGLSGVITFQKPILKLKTYNQTGEYCVKIEQNMRIKSLPHVKSAGIKINQKEEIF